MDRRKCRNSNVDMCMIFCYHRFTRVIFRESAKFELFELSEIFADEVLTNKRKCFRTDQSSICKKMLICCGTSAI